MPRLSAEDFDGAWYLKVNPDVREARVDAWQHYQADGHREGRLGAPIRAIELDHLLWRGFAKEAEVELRLLLRSGTARERAMAGWVLARHAASKGRWRSARAAIRQFTDAAASDQFVPHLGPWLLAIQAESRVGDIDAAWKAYRAARARFRNDRNLALAIHDIAAQAEDADQLISDCLPLLHAGTGLVPLSLASGTGTRFDWLQPRTPPHPIHDGPVVTVLVPAFNAERTLDTCLNSLIAQTWQTLEIIVVDDRSSDRTGTIAAGAAKRDPRIRVVQLPGNAGTYVARNTGLQTATGAFVTVQDADDWAHPQKIERQVAPLLHSDELAATVSHWVRADDALRMTRWRMEDGWIHRNVSSLMIRTGLRESLGYWDRVRTTADTEYYHRLISAFGTEAILETDPGVPMSFGRTNAGSLTLNQATHIATQFAGPRRRYLDAARDWHDRQISQLPQGADRATRAAALHFADLSDCRPFPAPAELGPTDRYTPSDDYGRVATSRFFNGPWYLRYNPDVLLNDIDPVRHYLHHGAFEDRDPGPLFPNAAWRRIAGLDPSSVPLLAVERSELPVFEGALRVDDQPRVLVFAHSADRAVFGAERSLLTALERLANGYSGTRYLPVAVLPSAVNTEYLEQVRLRAESVSILPQVWRHRFRQAPPDTVAAIRQMIRRHRPVEVHVNTLVQDAPLIAARMERCPSVVHVRELPAEDPALCRLLGDSATGLRRRLLQQSDRFIANSQAVADWLNCPGRTRIWPNTVDAALYGLPFAPGARLRVGMISSNLAKKGIADFVGVARRVAELEHASSTPTDRASRFLLIGPETADLAALGPLPSNVERIGYLSDPVSAIRQCDVILILSRFAESFGRTAAEALAAGRTVICYDRGTPPSLIQNSVTGFVVPADDPEGVAQAVFALSRDNDQVALRSAQPAKTRSSATTI